MLFQISKLTYEIIVFPQIETLLLEEQLSLQSALAWLAEQDNSSLQSHDESTPTPPLANVVIASIVLEDTRLRRRLQGVFT